VCKIGLSFKKDKKYQIIQKKVGLPLFGECVVKVGRVWDSYNISAIFIVGEKIEKAATGR